MLARIQLLNIGSKEFLNYTMCADCYRKLDIKFLIHISLPSFLQLSAFEF